MNYKDETRDCPVYDNSEDVGKRRASLWNTNENVMHGAIQPIRRLNDNKYSFYEIQLRPITNIDLLNKLEQEYVLSDWGNDDLVKDLKQYLKETPQAKFACDFLFVLDKD